MVQIENLTKKYGQKVVLSDIHLEIPQGQVLGLLGPNGSGKTTLMKILAGFLKSYKGKVTIFGKTPSYETKDFVSYLPDRNFLYQDMKIKDCERLFIDFFKDFDREKFKRLLVEMGLQKSMYVNQLSKGMQEKLNLILILSRKADLYIIDEPIAGVDPLARDQILELIITNIQPESSMIITTHLVRDIEKIFDRVCFINNGEIIEDHITTDLMNQTGLSVDTYYKELFSRSV